MLLSSRKSHAYIVRGGNAESAFVRELVVEMMGETERGKVMRGIHPDVRVVALEVNKNTNKLRAEITVEQIREAVYISTVAPNEAAVSVIVIENAHAMNTNAQNALLKTLEEPPAHLKLVLVSDEPGALLATVRSRCVTIDSGEAASAAPQRISELAEEYFEAVAQGDLALCEFSFELDKAERAELALLFPELRRLAAEKYRSGELSSGLSLCIAELAEAAAECFERNVAATHIAAILCNV